MNESSYPNEPSARFRDAVALLSRSRRNGGIYGLTGSASAFLVASAIKDGAGPLVIICPDGDTAGAAVSDVRFFLGWEFNAAHPVDDPALVYPSSDAMPYSSAAFETDVAIQRMATLFRLAESRAPRLLGVGLDALARRMIPRSEFVRTTFSLRVGEDVDRDDLVSSLGAAGYRRAPLVEEAGDFAVRGFIIDVYPPAYDFPVRIEQTGDRIESIRFFDPTNQRSKDTLSEVQVGPIGLVLPGEDGLRRGLEALREECEERGVEKKIKQRLIDDFSHGLRFPGADYYLPFFYDRLSSLLDYLPPDVTLLVPSPDEMARSLEDMEETIARGWERAAEEGRPVPPPDRLYLFRDELLSRLEEFRTVTLCALEVEEPERVGIRVHTRSNGDVRPALVQAKNYDSGMGKLVDMLREWRDTGNEVFLVSHTLGQAERLFKLLEPYDLEVDYRGQGFEPGHLASEPTPGIRLYVGDLSSGFRMPPERLIVLTEEEVFGARIRTTTRRRAVGTMVSSLTDLVEGQAVVHEDYGIGVFRGLTKKEFDGLASEVMVIEYSGGDLLYHPVERLQLIQKYVSSAEEPPRIDRLGGKGWAKAKAKVKRSIRDMANELLKIYATRKVTTREPYAPPDDNLVAFEASFPFEETPDQGKAIQEVMESMDSDQPMDRLVCGDVGYGKTEVALRGAFRAIMDGKQVAILVPTTVLAQQHFDTCRNRLNGYPIEIEMLSRFRSASAQKAVIKRLGEGKIDLVVGTHRLLSKDVSFKNLGLLVVDEEHRFGVAHKEKIKQFRATVDVLTLTATPIPRTLHFSLSGIRDLTVIDTPPANRKSIRTHVMRQSDEVIRDALMREVSRGGQVFYLHNRVKSIYKRAARLKELVPEASFGVAHGQMSERELEQVMYDFVNGNFNILVCTSIIESGLDIPRANTIVIERADTFGLADLYQLRGRVGRSNVRAYAYLLTPPESMMTPDAIKRLAVIQEHSSLGQGFRIAMRDLEIRGAGNILGTEQSGHVALVGYEMYLDLLEEAVQEIKGEKTLPRIDPEINLKIEALIPEDYVPEPQQRMSLYKRFSRATDKVEVDRLEDEMLDLYGRPPEPASHLVSVMRLRLAMKELRISKLDYNGKEIVLTFDSETPVRPEQLIAWSQKDGNQVRFIPEDRLTYRIGREDGESRVKLCFQLMDTIRNLSDPERLQQEANPW